MWADITTEIRMANYGNLQVQYSKLSKARYITLAPYNNTYNQRKNIYITIQTVNWKYSPVIVFTFWISHYGCSAVMINNNDHKISDSCVLPIWPYRILQNHHNNLLVFSDYTIIFSNDKGLGVRVFVIFVLWWDTYNVALNNLKSLRWRLPK